METEAFAEEFLAAMDCRGLLSAQALAKHLDLAGRRRLLDIAGGSGIYACSIVAHVPGLAASVLEKPPVDRIARRAIERRGFAGRVGVVAGDMLTDPLPTDHDVHLFSNVLHDWDEDVVRQLIHASAAALPPGGTIIVHDAFLNAAKTGPLQFAGYSVLLMHVTQGRCYSVEEMASWLARGGLRAAAPGPERRRSKCARGCPKQLIAPPAYLDQSKSCLINLTLVPRCERAWRASHATGPPSRRRRFGEVSP